MREGGTRRAQMRAPPPPPRLAAQSSKYQKRYFRLTAETLAYAKVPEDMSTGNTDDVQFFPIAQLQYVKRLQKVKLQKLVDVCVTVFRGVFVARAEQQEHRRGRVRGGVALGERAAVGGVERAPGAHAAAVRVHAVRAAQGRGVPGGLPTSRGRTWRTWCPTQSTEDDGAARGWQLGAEQCSLALSTSGAPSSRGRVGALGSVVLF
jgi:hypothetical protein